MITKSTLDQYDMTIGIECHVQFNTKTKLFSAVDNNAKDAEPNTKVSPICFGMPGVLPVLNEHAIDLAIKAGIALNANVAEVSKFDRKHYFYPDLPKGFQTTQLDHPIVGKGSIKIIVDGEEHTVGITRAHLEEDAGKSTHPDGKDYSLVDLNRAGTPLLEIVSEPDIHSAAQARAYARELYLLMKYADVSDVDLYHGNMRFDVNISAAKKGATELGTRAEVKNLNSFKAVERAAEYEFKRQVELLEKGEAVVQETRGWDDSKQKTFSQRSKEEAHDYRYFPEPDIPPVVLTKKHIENIRSTMPVLPGQVRKLLADLGLDSSQIETLVENKQLGDLLRAVIEQSDEAHAKRIANWLTGETQRIVNEPDYDWTQFKLTGLGLIELSTMVADKKLSSTGAKDVLIDMMSTGNKPEQIAQKKNLLQVSDESAVEAIVDQVLKDNPKAAEDVRNGEMKAIGFLVGQVMKESKGQANPQIAQQLVRKKLQS